MTKHGEHSNLMVFWEDGDGGWEPLETTAPNARGWVSARTLHFSMGFLGSVDVDALTKKAFNVLTSRSGVSQPACAGEAAARDAGVKVSSSSGTRIKWCVGQDDAGLFMKVASDLRAFTELTYPKSWKLVEQTTLSFAPSDGVKWLTESAPVPRGKELSVIDGGATVRLNIPEGSSGTVLAEMSALAWTLSGIWFGAEQFAGAVRLLNSKLGQTATTRWESFKRLLKGDAGSQEANALADCAKQGASATTAKSDAQIAVLALELGAGCGIAALQASVKEAASWWLVGVVAAAGALASLVSTGAHLLLTSGRELWDRLGFASGEDPTYTISIRQPRPNDAIPAELLGTWCSVDGEECLNFADYFEEYPEAFFKPEAFTEASGSTTYTLCLFEDLSLGEDKSCTVASSVYVSYFAPGVEWDCQEQVQDSLAWDRCDPDFTDEHDATRPRLVRVPNHQQGEQYADSRPLYRQ